MKQPLSIVHYWGGSPHIITSRYRWHVSILEKCVQRGWNAHIVFEKTPQDPQMRNALTEAGIEIHEVPRPRRQFDLRCVAAAWSVFSKVRCDIVHLHCVHTSPMIAAAMAGVPVRIWTNHSASDDLVKGIKPRGIHAISPSTRATCALAHLILPVSKNIRRELLDCGVPWSRMKIAPVPVDIRKYQVCPPPNLRKELSLSSQSVVISSVGQAIYRKAWDVLINAFAVARVQNPDLRLLLIGPTNGTPEQTEYYGILRKLVDELNVGETVSFLGARQDVPELLSITDVFAFPTRGEGLPGALAEAMAAGLPCVATRVSGNPELILHEATGLLIEVEDADGLTKSLLELVQNPTRRKQLGEAARKSLAQFALEYQVDHTMRLYESQLHRIPRHRID